MSAWIVGQDHIDLIVSGVVALTEGIPLADAPAMADALGKDLWTECHNSVNYRYSEDEAVPEYSWTPVPEVMEPELSGWVLVQLLHNVHCYTYQSCEHPGWKESKAHEVATALETELEKRLIGWPREPGMRQGKTDHRGTGAASWGWERKDGFPVPAKSDS